MFFLFPFACSFVRLFGRFVGAAAVASASAAAGVAVGTLCFNHNSRERDAKIFHQRRATASCIMVLAPCASSGLLPRIHYKQKGRERALAFIQFGAFAFASVVFMHYTH